MTDIAPHSPPFRADHVGSLLRPPELLRAREEHDAGRLEVAQLRAMEDDLIRRVVAMQEDVGLQAVTDGEYRRGVFYADFICRGLGGATVYYESDRLFFIDDDGKRIPVPLLKLHDRLKWRGPVHVDDFRFVQSATHRMVKLTMPSPTIAYSADRGSVAAIYPGAESLRDDIVEAWRREFRVLSDAGCRYVQLDEVPIAMYCDQAYASRMTKSGVDVEALLFETFPGLINAALEGRPPTLHVAMHLCRGNNQSGWLTEGGYDPVAEMLFNRINVDSYFLEYDTSRAGTFEPLRFVPKNKTVVLGIVSSKLARLESKDELKRRIDQASKYIDPDQLGLSPQCGFASTSPGNRLTQEQQFAKLRRVVEVAREVWGQV